MNTSSPGPITGCICTMVALLSCCAAAPAGSAMTVAAIRSDTRRVRRANIEAPVCLLRSGQLAVAVRPEAEAPFRQLDDVVHQKADDAEQQDDGELRTELHGLIVLRQQHP